MFTSCGPHFDIQLQSSVPAWSSHCKQYNGLDSPRIKPFLFYKFTKYGLCDPNIIRFKLKLFVKNAPDYSNRRKLKMTSSLRFLLKTHPPIPIIRFNTNVVYVVGGGGESVVVVVAVAFLVALILCLKCSSSRVFLRKSAMF